MSIVWTKPPLRFDPSFERIAPDEDETIAAIVETMRRVSAKTLADSGHANRSVHAKAHALLRGELSVLGDLPEPLAQGLFAAPGRHPVVLRFSTTPGDMLDDAISVPRGLAVKVIGVEGPRLPGSADSAAQDFVMIDAPAFSAPDAKGFLRTLKLLAATTDRAEGAKIALSAVLRGAERVVEAFGGKSAALVSLGGHPQTHPAGATYYTQVPLRHGPYVAKLAVAPVSPELVALTDAPVDLGGKPNGLRDSLAAFFAAHGGTWEVRAQLMTDATTMPVEDASVVWPEGESPYVAVARIVVEPQSSYDEARHQAYDEALAFSPWDGIEAHRPIGSIMRARKPAYAMSSTFRAEHNGCPIVHPRTAEDLDA